MWFEGLEVLQQRSYTRLQKLPERRQAISTIQSVRRI